MASQNIRPEDLPAWMRTRSYDFDWGLVAVLALSLLLITPWILTSGLPQGTEANLYEYRSLEVARLLKAGAVYSRWAPDFNHALGSPVFNYLAPLPHYLAGYHQIITDDSPLSSIKLLLGLALLVASGGMYFFASQRWGVLAGIIAALVYACSPSIVQTHLNGDLSLLLALAILPWALWALDGLWLNGRRRHLWQASGFLAALMLSDTRIAFLGGFVLVAGLVSLRWSSKVGTVRRSYRRLRLLFSVIVGAGAISAFFWLPAIVERDVIHWDASSSDPRGGPVTLTESLGGLLPFDSHQPVTRTVGVQTWLLALVGAMAAWHFSGRRLNDSVVFLALGLILILLASSPFEGLWPSPSSFQPVLPYHAVLVASLCLSAASARSVEWLNRLSPRLRVLGIVVLASLLLVLASPTALPLSWQTTAPDYLSMLRDELRGDHLGSLRNGVLLPATTPRLPDPPPQLINNLQTNHFQRLSQTVFSADMYIAALDESLLHSRYSVVNAAQAFDVEFYALYYPGWTVRLGGQPRPVVVSNEGLIRVTIPLANDELFIAMEGTPLRYLAWAISGAGFLLLFVVDRSLMQEARDPAALAAGVKG